MSPNDMMKCQRLNGTMTVKCCITRQKSDRYRSCQGCPQGKETWAAIPDYDPIVPLRGLKDTAPVYAAKQKFYATQPMPRAWDSAK